MTQAVTPNLYIETTSTGEAFVRVEEMRQTPITNPDIVLADGHSVDQDRDGAIDIFAPVNVTIDHFVMEDQVNGILLKKTGNVSIYNWQYDSFSQLYPHRYGEALHISDKTPGNDTTGITYGQRIYADGHQKAIGTRGVTYGNSNKDFVAIEDGGNVLYLRDVTAKNFSDGIIDAKADNVVYIMNATLDSAHFDLRVWDGATLVLVNCQVITGDAPNKAVWLGGSNSVLHYYNTTWNGQDTLPEKLITRVGGTANTATPLQLDHNPLADISYFESNVKQVHVDYSLDGVHWQAMDLGASDDSSIAPVGDNLFSLASLKGSDYYVRSSYTLQDGSLSQPSRVAHVNAQGDVEYITRIANPKVVEHVLHANVNDAVAGDASNRVVDAFIIDNAQQHMGHDIIHKFGTKDVLLTTAQLKDNNGDNILFFGGDRVLNFVDERGRATQGDLAIYNTSGKQVTALEYQGITSSDGQDYFVYSQRGVDINPASVGDKTVVTHDTPVFVPQPILGNVQYGTAGHSDVFIFDNEHGNYQANNEVQAFDIEDVILLTAPAIDKDFTTPDIIDFGITNRDLNLINSSGVQVGEVNLYQTNGARVQQLHVAGIVTHDHISYHAYTLVGSPVDPTTIIF